MEQTETNLRQTLEYQMRKPMKTFYSHNHSELDQCKRLPGLINLEEYNSVFKITESTIGFYYSQIFIGPILFFW